MFNWILNTCLRVFNGFRGELHGDDFCFWLLFVKGLTFWVLPGTRLILSRLLIRRWDSVSLQAESLGALGCSHLRSPRVSLKT